MYIGNIPQNTLKLEVRQMPGLFVPDFQDVSFASFGGKVVMNMDGKTVLLDTITAHKIGLAMGRYLAVLAPNEMFVLFVNGQPIKILKQYASKVCSGLLRKADDADDWQLQHRRVLR